MENSRQVALTLFIVGILLFSGALYFGVANEGNQSDQKPDKGYHAEPINLDTESGIDTLVRVYNPDVAVSQYDFYEDPAYPHQWNTSTWQVLTAAMTNGSVTVSDGQIREDLQDIETKFQFVRVDSDDRRQYYRITIEQDGTIVHTDPASYREVATAITEQAPHYENLTAAEKETVDEILNASDGDSGSYAPRVDDAFVEKLPTNIWKNDTLYRIKVAVYID
jgi:hypothetical protein